MFIKYSLLTSCKSAGSRILKPIQFSPIDSVSFNGITPLIRCIRIIFLEILINHFISYHIIHQENPNRLSSSSFHIDSVDVNIVYLLCNMFSCNNIFVSGFCLSACHGHGALAHFEGKEVRIHGGTRNGTANLLLVGAHVTTNPIGLLCLCV